MFVGILVIASAVKSGSDEAATEGASTSSESTATSTVQAIPPTGASAPAFAVAPPPDPDDAEPHRDGQQRLVSRVIDGDTIKLADGEEVRVLGIDACEAGTHGGESATIAAKSLIQVMVTLRTEPGAPDRDRFGRLLRYVTLLDGSDFGEAMVPATHTGIYQGDNDASAAYLSRLEALDGAARDCDGPDLTPEPQPNRSAPDPDPDRHRPREPAEEWGTLSGGCEPGYSPCVPSYPPDLDCPDLAGPYVVTGSDPHNLDGNNDGEGCE
ncbi:thermonuclease family protein [Pseudonocardia sp. C8]|uniref:thermonuclease family protein n=1 Tax=Pseudonocardia sp. C8 TaxID=2762759 RepID=UPI001C92BE0C|nr:thermonuclease family protein [Pseudonocardia sp. C8]